MKVKFVVIGKTAFDDLKVGEQRYQSRLIHYCQFERLELPDVKNPKALSKAQIKEKEGQLLLEKLQPQDLWYSSMKMDSTLVLKNWPPG